MKLNWIVILAGMLFVAATFSISFLEGAEKASEITFSDQRVAQQ